MKIERIDGRECGDCSLCCKVVKASEFVIDPEDGDIGKVFNKPAGKWCRFMLPGNSGCGIHSRRPDACRNFQCLWLEGFMPDEFRPRESRVVVCVEAKEGVGPTWILYESIVGATEKGLGKAVRNWVIAASINTGQLWPVLVIPGPGLMRKVYWPRMDGSVKVETYPSKHDPEPELYPDEEGLDLIEQTSEAMWAIEQRPDLADVEGWLRLALAAFIKLVPKEQQRRDFAKEFLNRLVNRARMRATERGDDATVDELVREAHSGVVSRIAGEHFPLEDEHVEEHEG